MNMYTLDSEYSKQLTMVRSLSICAPTYLGHACPIFHSVFPCVNICVCYCIMCFLCNKQQWPIIENAYDTKQGIIYVMLCYAIII